MEDYRKLENLLRCPITGESLHFTEEELPEKLKSQVPEGVKTESGYLNSSETAFFPIQSHIICLLPQYAITTVQTHTHKDSEAVRAFYDQFGWAKNEENKYQDNKLFVDQRSVADEYRSLTTKRVNNYLEKKGKYLLDIASGPVYQPEYQEFSQAFEYRICIDLSIKALEEARQNLPAGHGIFILGDITNIPLKNNCCDNVISMHTLYHVPKERQALGINELLRVCKPERSVVIAYNWGWHSLLMNIALLPYRALRLVRRLLKKYQAKKADQSNIRQLYFYSHNRSFFYRNKPDNASLEFNIQKSLHENFIKLYLGEGPGSKKLLRRIYEWESKYPKFFGKHGQFPLIVLQKSANS